MAARGLAPTIAMLALAALGGCASVSPQHVSTDRMEYGQVVAESWKRQTLLNVVRLRYADAPVFLDVASIINSYSEVHKATGQATFPSRTDPKVLEVGGEATWSNTPTVTYQPLMGDRFTKSLLQPVPPMAVFQLMQGGWPADLVMRIVVTSINGLRNNFSGAESDPAFDRLVEAMTRIQRAGGLSIRVETRKDGSAIVVVMRRERSASLDMDARIVQESLGLEPESTDFEVVYGLVPKTNREVAMLSRSMLDILLQLGFSIDIPPEHLREGRALSGRVQSGETPASQPVRIRVGQAAPPDAYAAIPYRGLWYWIDDTDVASKRVFTFMMILFSLAETGQSYSAPVVTVPSR